MTGVPERRLDAFWFPNWYAHGTLPDSQQGVKSLGFDSCWANGTCHGACQKRLLTGKSGSHRATSPRERTGNFFGRSYQATYLGGAASPSLGFVASTPKTNKHQHQQPAAAAEAEAPAPAPVPPTKVHPNTSLQSVMMDVSTDALLKGTGVTQSSRVDVEMDVSIWPSGVAAFTWRDMCMMDSQFLAVASSASEVTMIVNKP